MLFPAISSKHQIRKSKISAMDTTSFVSFMRDAERLIAIAAKSLNSFFISKEMCATGSPDFVGFLRDSLTRDFQMTTGGGGVVSDLLKAEPYLPYLQSNREIPHKTANRDSSRKFIMEEARDSLFGISPSFLTLSPLTYSIYASISNRRMNTRKVSNSRSMLFNSVNLYHFLEDEWPSYENIDRAHPFVAYKVQGSVISLTQNANGSIAAIHKGFKG